MLHSSLLNNLVNTSEVFELVMETLIKKLVTAAEGKEYPGKQFKENDMKLKEVQ